MLLSFGVVNALYQEPKSGRLKLKGDSENLFEKELELLKSKLGVSSNSDP